MIQALIFDVGGVLIRTDDPTPRRRAEQRHGLGPGRAEFLVFNSEMGRQAQHGLISSGELWAWVQAQLGADDATMAAFRRDFFGGDHLNATDVTLIRRLHGAYQTAIISNAMDDLNEVVTAHYPMADAFDLIVGSAYEGIMKPDARIFGRTLARLGRQPAEAVFVDDFMHNVDGARAVGMHAIHYTPDLDLAAALAEFGVAIPHD
jgi:epoxide hydrolase-like predicted phosphatase